MPRSCGLMRPSAVTAVASVITSAAPPTARLPRCTKCQSFEKPPTLEYWHIGETMMRLERVSDRIGKGSKRCVMAPIVTPSRRNRTYRSFLRAFLGDSAHAAHRARANTVANTQDSTALVLLKQA